MTVKLIGGGRNRFVIIDITAFNPLLDFTTNLYLTVIHKIRTIFYLKIVSFSVQKINER